MTVLEEILEWSHDRPAWQRDALRRLVLNGELSENDIGALTEICKSVHGLAEQQRVVPLSKDHIPVRLAGSDPVSLLSIFHHRGVNALAENQTLSFGPHLTIVYGDNAAGKTGYIRILKSACRARKQEQILGDVTSGTTPLSPVVSIKYKVGTEAQPREWAGDGDDEYISHVSVFDTQCAAVYLTEKTDVAFRPFGLDLFDKLVRACRAVRERLESEQRALNSVDMSVLHRQIPEGTAARNFTVNVSSLTSPERLEALARLSPEEEARSNLLERSLLDLQANDPEKLARELNLRTGRVRGLARHLNQVEVALSAQAVAAAFASRAECQRKSEEARRLRELAFPSGMLAGTGSETWTGLWEGARRFSQESAYPSQEFPVVEDGARCVLCQQDLDHAARHRLEQFQTFVASATERELRQQRDAFAQLSKTFIDLRITTEAVEDALKEIRIEDEALAEAATAALATNERRRAAIILALNGDRGLSADCLVLVSVADKVETLAGQIASRIETLRSGTADDHRESMAAEARELSGRKLLAMHKRLILDQIERKKKYAAYSLCIDETRTQTITQKSTAVTKTIVSQKLKESFSDELKELAFRHVEVELRDAGGAEGVLYHKLVLTRAPGVELPKVVSEGEQRCLSIAAFFAELSTGDDPSGIVFDDPVSSLDYRWRDGVARRLVTESKRRQVIIFTHDIVFLLLIKQYAKDQNVDQLDQHVQHLANGAGVCTPELPWVALPVRRKVGYLKKEWQAADKLFRTGHQAAYEKDAKYLYGLLREAWERALEEVLLNGIVERFRPGVQTQQVATLADITSDDCRTLEAAMTKCSRWLAGHDEAAAARASVPEPAELKDDIDELDEWVRGIHKRRSK